METMPLFFYLVLSVLVEICIYEVIIEVIDECYVHSFVSVFPRYLFKIILKKFLSSLFIISKAIVFWMSFISFLSAKDIVDYSLGT